MCNICLLMSSRRLRGATVARLTPDQKVACSNHVGVIFFFRFAFICSSTICLTDAGLISVLKIRLNFACAQFDVCLDANARCLSAGTSGVTLCLCTATYFEKNNVCGKLVTK